MISYLYGQRINKESESSTVPRRGNHAPKGRRVMGERRAVSLETLQGRAPVELRVKDGWFRVQAFRAFAFI